MTSQEISKKIKELDMRLVDTQEESFEIVRIDHNKYGYWKSDKKQCKYYDLNRKAHEIKDEIFKLRSERKALQADATPLRYVKEQRHITSSTYERVVKRRSKDFDSYFFGAQT